MRAHTALLWTTLPASLLLLAPVLIVFAGCSSEMVCGPGTIEVGNACIVDEGASDPGGSDVPPPAYDDAGMEEPTADAGSGGGGGGGGGGGTGGGDYTPDPPGGGGGGATGTGCDAAAGECDTWEEAIAAGLVDRQMAAGCGRAMMLDERIDAVAERHAEHQAAIDMLTSDSPEGSLFTQVGDAGVEFRDVAALFSVSVDGAEDVLARWEAGRDTAAMLERCDHAFGVGVATGESGDSYVTVLMARF